MRSGPAEIAAALAGLGVDSGSANQQGWASIVCIACGVPGSSPAFRVNVLSGAFACMRCGVRSGDKLDLAQFIANPQVPSLREQNSLGGGTRRSEHPPLTDALVDRYARMLMDSPTIVADIERRRGWTAQTMERLRLGWDGSHIWIPIVIDDKLVDARMYDPFQRTKIKSYHYANPEGLRRTNVWLPFGKKSLEGHSSVWFKEGEPDGILSAQMGFPTAVVTGGALTWCEDIPQIIGSKRAVFCYDMDAAGRRGARSHVARCKNFGIQALDLQFELSDPSLNDFTDAVMKDHRDSKWFRDVARAQWGEGTAPPTAPPMRVPLGGGVPGERITVKGHVAGIHTVPLLVPQMVVARCRVDWQPDRACRGCPVGTSGGNRRVDIEPEDQDLMLLAATTVRMQEGEFRRITGAPGRCPRVEFETPTMWQVQPIKLIPPMTDRAGGDSTVRAALCVCPADGRPPPVRANQLYEFDGRIMPDVKTNEWTLLSGDCVPAEDDVDAFRMTADLATAFRESFNPTEWTLAGVEASMSAEESSLARHVTKVYGRRTLLRALDLVYHSALSFAFRGNTSPRGWMSLGCIGDSRTGKSETFTRFSQYIGLGRMLNDTSNTTFAGVVGGLQQIGQGDKAWVVTWGLVPTNDRGMVILDELSSMSTADIGRMSGMRSQGVAELTKIRSASTPARTRLVMSGNPRGTSMFLSSYGTAVEGFMELIGAPEDIARFDIAVAMKGGFDKEAADQALGPRDLPIDVSLRRDLVRFAWSRRSDNIEWEQGAEEACVVAAKVMVEKYDWSIPLVEPSEQDLRIARVAVATAIRTFSTTEDPSRVLVRRCHVDFAVSMLNEAYCGDLAYDVYSQVKNRMKLDAKAAEKLVAGMHRDPATAARSLMTLRRVSVNSIGMVLGLSAEEGRIIIATLAQIGAAEFSKDDRGASTSFVWTPAFANLLRTMEHGHTKRADPKDDPF